MGLGTKANMIMQMLLKTKIFIAKAAESPVNGEHEDVAYTEEKSSASLVVDNHKSKKPLPNEKDICIMDYSKCSCITRNVQYFDSKNKSQGGHKVGIDETVRIFF